MLFRSFATEYNVKSFFLVFNAAYRIRPTTTLNELTVSHELLYGLGGYVPLRKGTIRLGAEFFGGIGAGKGNTGDLDTSPLEWQLNGRMYFTARRQIYAGLGAGTRLTGGYAPDFRGVGVVGVLKNGAGPTVLLRADMDGLPVVEETGLPYASQVKVRDARGATGPEVVAALEEALLAPDLAARLQQIDQAPDLWKRLVERLDQARADGVPLVGSIPGRPAGVLYGWRASTHPFHFHAAWRETAALPIEQRIARMAEPAVRARLLADMPASERPAIEVMRTDTPTWAALVEASRHAIGPWAVRSALHSNICNRSVPTRPIAAPSQS